MPGTPTYADLLLGTLCVVVVVIVFPKPLLERVDHFVPEALLLRTGFGSIIGVVPPLDELNG